MTGLAVPIAVVSLAAIGSWPLGILMRRILDPPQNDKVGQSWAAYCRSLLTFNVVMFLAVFLVLTTQGRLPLNPDGKESLEASLAFHTAVSFTTNTNLQHYSGEASLSYLSQLSLMWLQFVSAAVGIAALVALARALSGRRLLGNFHVDTFRATVFVLLPLSVLWAAVLVVCGVPMTFAGAAEATTLEGATQTIARGPVAAFIAIKQLGTNGGGFFGPNCAHPFENPTYLSNIANTVAIIIIPMASVWLFGLVLGRVRHAAVIFAAMLIIYLGMTTAAIVLESAPTAALEGLPIADSPNLEGKELRFAVAASPTWAATTTATSNGSVNSMHDSLNPLAGLVPLVGMWLNMAFGGDGVGMINMFLFIVVAVFLAGMMVGRTPEYLTRKIETPEMRLALLTMLLHPLLILGGVALFASTEWGRSTTQDPGSHGFTEIVYEFTSAAANNGSGFEGLGDNTVPWNVATGLVMLFGRFIPIITPLAIAASLGRKKAASEGPGTFRTDSWMFGVILLGTVLIVGALLFLPLAVLGPIAEHLSIAS
ncbi:MAG: potassium-transporting ATPase subunit KdpA [Pirellulales bacterium]